MLYGHLALIINVHINSTRQSTTCYHKAKLLPVDTFQNISFPSVNESSYTPFESMDTGVSSRQVFERMTVFCD